MARKDMDVCEAVGTPVIAPFGQIPRRRFGGVGECADGCWAVRMPVMAPFGQMLRWRLGRARTDADGAGHRRVTESAAVARFGQMRWGWSGGAWKGAERWMVAAGARVIACFGQIRMGAFRGGAGWRGAATGMAVCGRARAAGRPPERAEAVPSWPAGGRGLSGRRTRMGVKPSEQEN